MIGNLQCSKTLSFAILFLFLVHGIIGEKKDGSARKTRPPKHNCADPTVMNADVIRTTHGFQFTCNPPFKMYGRKTSRCVNGSLNYPPPACTASNCDIRAIGRLNNMVIMTEPEGFKGRVLEFSCFPGYTIKGPRIVLCNGPRWSKGQPQCIEDVVSTPTPPMNEENVVSTTSSITTEHKGEIKSPTAFSITLRPPPRKSPTIFISKLTTVHSIQSSAVHVTHALSTGAPDSYATTADVGDITSSISTEDKALQSSAVTTASLESEKAPATPEMPEDTEEETSKKDDRLSSFDQSMSEVTTQIDDTEGVGRSEISDKSDKTLELTTQAAITEIDEPEPTIGEVPSSPADDFLPPIDIMGHTDAGPTDQEELRKATSPKIDDGMTEVEQVESEPLNFIANTATYPKQDKKTTEPLKSTAQDDDNNKENEAGILKSSTIRSIFQTASIRSGEFEGEKDEHTEYQVTVALIVLAVVAACVLLALATYIVVIKVNACRSQDPTQNEHAAVAYAEKDMNGSSAVNDATAKSHSTQL